MTSNEKTEELAERFRLNVLDYEGCSINSHISKQCALIAEEFAIGFAEWFWINKNNFFKGERDWYLGFNQILEIYKKEKGL